MSQVENKKKSARRQRANRQNRPPIAGILVIVGLIAVAAFIIYAMFQSPQQSTALDGVEQFTVERGHQQGKLTYAQVPPVGGIHNPVWQNCGVYDQPLANENAVHSLEHGAIWITYQPDLPAADVEKLRTITRQSGYRLLSPYPGLPKPVVASAWGYQIKLNGADDPRLMAFIAKYEQNPNGPEPGAPCSGGTGTPQ